ncbi:MAG: hypothetical protein ABR587_07845, partial [Candidatus Binatia bacterium]
MEVDKKGDPVNASVGLGWTTPNSSTQPIWLALPVALAGLFFYFDLNSPDRMLFGLPYVLVVVLAQLTGGALGATVAASAASALVLAVPFLTSAPAGADPGWLVFVARAFVVAAIAMMALFLRQRDAARETVRTQEGVLATSTHQRSDELRLVNAQLHREIAERRRAELRSGYLASIVESSA